MTGKQPAHIMGGEATFWCHDGHDPCLIAERHSDSDNQACPECGNEFDVSVEIQEVT